MSLEDQIAAAEAYESSLVPSLMEEWAPRVVAAASLGVGDRVLDVGCGTGILTRYVAEAVLPGGSVTGVDPNAGMLAVAEKLAPDASFEEGVAESLPLPDESFDAVVSQFVLMFVPDRLAALQEMDRVLTPEGRIAVAVWADIEHSPGYVAEASLLERTVGERAAEAIHAPYALGDVPALEKLFGEAGLSPTVQTYDGRVSYPSVAAMVGPDLEGWLPVFGVHLDPEQKALVLREAEDALREFTTPDGSVSFGCKAHIITA